MPAPVFTRPVLPVQQMTAQPSVAYGLRRLNGKYSGPLIQVRRSSDSSLRNIYYDPSGNLDTADLLAFVGSGSGYVAIWYDQSGNGNNAGSATATYQPQIVNSGAYSGIVNFAASATANYGALGFSSRISTGYPYTTNAVFKQITSTGGIILGDVNYGSQYFRISGSSNSAVQFVPGTPFGTTFNASAPTVVTQVAISQSSYQGWANGASVGTGAAPGAYTFTDGIGIWSSTGNSGGNSGYALSELLIFPSTLSTADRQALEHGQQAYFGVAGV